VDGKIYLIGGRMPAGLYIVNTSIRNDVYDPETDTWTQMAPIPTAVMGYASAVFNNKIYIISGGNESGPDYNPTNLVQIFDPETNQWTNGTQIPTSVCYARACATTGLFAPKRIYVIGGTTVYYDRWATYNVVNLTQIYDPETDTWITGSPMLTPRCSFAIAVVNDEIYTIGGQKEEDHLVVNEKYTSAGYIPEFPSWTTIYIRADGSVEGTDKIQRVGNVYTFTDDISTGRYTGSIEIDVDGIIIERDDIVVDGAGYTLEAIFPTFEMGAGIILWDRSNVTIKNLQIRYYATGISIDNSSNSNIRGNKITANAAVGFKLQSTSNENNIFGNNITGSIGGIEFHGNSSNNSVYENWIVDNADGMNFHNSYNNSIYDNVIAFNRNSGIFLQFSAQNKFFRNDIVENEEQVICMYGTNIWDNGSVGNYWSDYNGTDKDGDGIGDEPHHIPTFQIPTGVDYGVDNYPLVEPIIIPEFPSWIILPLIMIVALVVVVLKKTMLRGLDEK